jgi:hypothetical protein
VLATMLGFAAFPAWAIAQGLPSRVRLPIEVAGEDGSTASVTVLMPPDEGERVHALWMQIHGLEYEDMVSVRVNESPWLTLNNHSVAVAEPGKSYGGIGGGFATLKLTLAIPAGSVADGANTVSFRFNRSNGVVSGFRVLAFNFLAAGGRPSMGAEAFEQEDPDLWAAPLPDAQNIAAGRDLWNAAPLVASSLPSARPIRAHCADCHARDGRDLKYFNYSNVSIAARCRFHGLSALQGDQVASYIRALPLPNPGRPWNPPYQPGPGQAGGDKFGKPADLWQPAQGSMPRLKTMRRHCDSCSRKKAGRARWRSRLPPFLRRGISIPARYRSHFNCRIGITGCRVCIHWTPGVSASPAARFRGCTNPRGAKVFFR